MNKSESERIIVSIVKGLILMAIAISTQVGLVVYAVSIWDSPISYTSYGIIGLCLLFVLAVLTRVLVEIFELKKNVKE